MISIFLAQMLNNSHIHVKGSADRYRDFIHINDVVEAFHRCLTCEESVGMRINIATGVKTTVRELVDMLISHQNNKITVEYSGETAGDIDGIYADVSNMKSILGMNKFISIEEGLSGVIDWAKSK